MCVEPRFLRYDRNIPELSRYFSDPCYLKLGLSADQDPVVKSNLLNGIYVPCGHCPECIAARQREWFVKFSFEDRYWKKLNCNTRFVTLTYNNDHLPSSREHALRDWQAMLKQMRRKLGFRPRFFLVSEYGGRTHRFHYHFLLFGIPKTVEDKVFSAFILDCWNNRGFISASVASGKQFNYVSKYVTKDLSLVEDGEWKDFCTFSKRPPLGFEYAEKYLRAYIDSISGRSLMIDGYHYSTPRYFRDKLWSEDIREVFSDPEAYGLESFPLVPTTRTHSDDVWNSYRIRLREFRNKKKINYGKIQANN